jgi:predicted SnoaL-like aldol condensation-catalyzing enzyme
MKQLEEIQKLREQLNEKIQKVGKKAFVEAFQEFFDANPDIKALSWSQYAPHFNDGDACVFHVHDFLYTTDERVDEDTSFSGEESYDEDEDDSDEVKFKCPSEWSDDAKRKKLSKAINAFYEEIVDEDVFEAVFGDSVRVLALPGKFVIEDCEHD